MSRRQVLDAIRRKPEVTVLIVGGGINGIGVFRDLARQGVDVLLVEKGDFCSGTSAASSHMVHGGLRYLENGQFRLVGEAVRERNLLLRNAPHYVQPLPVAIPVFRWLSGLMNAPLQFMGLRKQPAERGALVIKIGLTLYDAYARRQCPGGTLPHHGFILRQSALQRFPRLNPSVKCVASYYDAAVSVPERIGLELVLDAESDSPSARAVNYLRLRRAEGGSVTLQDADTGEELVVKPRVVVNASGPWVDIVNRAMGQDTRFIGGTKGSHIVLQNPGLRAAMGEHEWFFENADGRMVLLFPLGDNVLVGTSDIRVEGPEDVRCTKEEVDYFLGMIGKVFPGIHAHRRQIVFRFSGVRPLPASDNSITGRISRDHSMRVIEPSKGIHFPVYCLIGGKWTTFRAFAEEVTDGVLSHLGRRRQGGTESLAIGGGQHYPLGEEARRVWLAGLAEEERFPTERLETLLDRYGTRSREVARFIASGPDRRLDHKRDYSRREIAFLATREKLCHLEDLVLRRSRLAMRGEISLKLLEELAEIIGAALGWGAGKRQAEIDAAVDVLGRRHGVAIE